MIEPSVAAGPSAVGTAAPPLARLPVGGAWTWVREVPRHPQAVVGACIVLAAVVLAIVGPSLSPYDPIAPDAALRLRPPSSEHLFGTDRVGRDILTRVIEGLRVTLSVASGAVVIALLIGTPIGAVAGYYGRGADAVLMRFIDA